MSSKQRVITVGVDGSDGGRRALAWAMRHAVATGALVDVVTAWSWDGMAFASGNLGGPDEERQHSADVQKRDIDKVVSELTGPEPIFTSWIVEGSPAKVLTDAAKSAELLVVGSHGRGYLATVLLGSVSEACVRRSSAPVVIVPAHARTADAT